MKFKILQWVAIVLILVAGYLHFILIPHEYEHAPYVGWLFFADAIGSLVSAVGIFRQKIWSGWVLGVFIAVGSILAYIQSRTFGLPGMDVEEWLDAIGIPAKIIEGMFLIAFIVAKPWDVSVMNRSFLASFETGKRLAASKYFYPSMMIVLVIVGISSYQLGVWSAAAEHETEHLLPDTVISVQTLEDEYGIQMTLVAITAAGGLVDVRYKVIDPEKAILLATEEDGIMPMVYVESGDIMLMPDAHMRTQKLVAGRMYFTLIPNAQNAVKRGSSVIVVFNDIALEPMITQ